MLSFSAPSTQTLDDCPPKETTTTTIASTTTVTPNTTTTVPVVTTTPTVAPSCSVPPELAFQGEPEITPANDPGYYVVTDGVWEDIPNCTNTFTYKWQYTAFDLFFGPIPEDSWFDYTGLIFSSTSYGYLYDNADLVDCATYARALVTATNESGLTTTIPAGPLIEMCS